MYSFWSLRTINRQLTIWGGILLTGTCLAQAPSNYVDRRPASYVPDDDVIVKPVQNELSFYQQYIASDNSEDVVASRNQIKVWQQNQEFADQYHMNTTLRGAYFVPTPEEKWEYFKDRYLRYLRRKGEQPIKDQPKTWYQEYRASNEVDTIDEIEGRFKQNNRTSTAEKSASSGSGKKVMPDSFQEKEVSLWKNNKLIFQPRVDQGILLVGFKGPLGYLRAWVGVNGRTEVNFQRDFESTGTRFMYNYYTDSGKYFTLTEQKLVQNVYARYTSSLDPRTQIKDDTLMLLYAKQF